jgi:hypothetical protein
MECLGSCRSGKQHAGIQGSLQTAGRNVHDVVSLDRNVCYLARGRSFRCISSSCNPLVVRRNILVPQMIGAIERSRNTSSRARLGSFRTS